ncbi:MAG TPA: F0F1 ATP synthase subunit B [Planctomycetes bacterium]|nr:F0F1 ATP synthase subunit B [Planctomycetota bacterium]HIK61377.1 ATP synthase F0 subunit B [Planctomycetota bacterium]
MIASILTVSSGGDGFNPLDVGGAGNFLWTLIIFGLALIPMWKMVFSKIAVMANARDEKAAEAVTLASRANEEAEKARAEVEVRLGEAQAEASKLLAGARERADARERDIIENAKKEADAMIESARAAILSEQDKALSAIRAEVVELSLSAASRVIGRQVGSEDDRRVVAEIVGGPADGAGA